MNTSNFTASCQSSIPTQIKFRERENKILVGTVVKSNIGGLEEEVMAGCSIRIRKELTGVVQAILRKKRLLVRFQDGCKNNLSLNKLTIMVVKKIPD